MSRASRGFVGRVTLGMSGQAFSRLVLAAYTVVLVPILIRAWGVDGYGQWIALTAVASYMGMSNFGLVTTSANAMVIATGAGDTSRARRTFQMSINVTLYVVLPIIALFVCILAMTPISRGLHLSQINSLSASLIIACCGASLWFQTLRGVMGAALFATGSYGLSYYVQGAVKLCELVGIAVAVSVFSGSQVAAAAWIAVMGFVELLVISACASRAASWARVDFRVFDRSWLYAQAKPTIGFLVSNFSTGGIMNQGPRVILSALLGGQAVALYAIYGTAMRIVDQLLLTMVLPLEVEIAHCAGAENFRRIYRLIVVGTHISWVFFLLVSAGLMMFGPIVFRLWTADRIHFSHGFMALYLCMSAANLQGRVSLHALTSTNKLFGPSFLIFGSAAASIGLGTAIARQIGIDGMVLGGIAGELVNSMIVVAAVSRWLGKPVKTMVADLLDLKSSMGELRARSLNMWYRLWPGA